MRMIHFIDPRGMEKNHDWHCGIKENCDTDKLHLNKRSNTVWDFFKRRLLVLFRRERL